MTFQAFKKLVEDQFNAMQSQQMLFETDFDVWNVYLDSFPPGTNEIFKVRREHDCGCCRNFVKNVGHLVTLDGKTVWDTAAVSAPWPFNEVAQHLQQRVKQLPPARLYGANPVHFTFGSKPNYDPKNDRNWDHFYGQAAPADQDFVLLYPAGADLPVNVQVDGSLLAKSDQAKLTVRVKRDVFVYRDQVSFDGKIWKRGQDCIGGNIVFSLPGDVPGSNGQARDGVSPGVLAARFDLRGEAAGK